LKIVSYPSFMKELKKLLKNSSNLQSFKIKILDNKENVTGFLGEFILNQKKLERLEIERHFCSGRTIDAIFNDNFVDRFNSKLKSMAIVSNLQYNKNFSRFLMKQAENIEELALNDEEMDFHYMRLVLNNFQNLQKLTVNLSTLLNDSRIEEIEKIQLHSVKELKILGHCDEVETFTAFIGVFPNIETLDTVVFNFLFQGIIEKLPKLRKLIAQSIRIELLAFSKSESLREIDFRYVACFKDPYFVQILAEVFPNLEEIKIKNIVGGTLNQSVDRDVGILLESLKLFRNLKHFEVVNDEPGEILINPDADVEQPAGVEMSDEFHLALKTFRGKKSLEASEYFHEKHAAVLERLVMDLEIEN
jgi:hypothetical protein